MTNPSKIRHRNQKPFWLALPDTKFDISQLRPASLSKSERFETSSDVQALSLRREAKIGKQIPALAGSLRDCRRGRVEVCGSPSCPRCGRLFRLWLTARGLEAFENLNGPSSRIITMYLADVPEGQLASASMQRAHAALRQRLNRAGLCGVLLIGGTEVAYRAKQHEWILHVHLLCLRFKRNDGEKLKAAARGSPTSKPLKQQKIKSPARQISYLQKFNTLHRPGVQHANRRARAYPLPRGPFAELMAFYAAHSFADFLFLFGARRRGTRIVIEATLQKKAGVRLRAYPPTRHSNVSKKSVRRRE